MRSVLTPWLITGPVLVQHQQGYCLQQCEPYGITRIGRAHHLHVATHSRGTWAQNIYVETPRWDAGNNEVDIDDSYAATQPNRGYRHESNQIPIWDEGMD